VRYKWHDHGQERDRIAVEQGPKEGEGYDLLVSALRTAVSGNLVPVELLGNDHGSKSQVCAKFEDGLSKCELDR